MNKTTYDCIKYLLTLNEPSFHSSVGALIDTYAILKGMEPLDLWATMVKEAIEVNGGTE